MAGMLAAIGVFISTLYIFIVIYEGWDAMSPIVKANRFLMLSFALMVWLGYRNRKQPAWHKRFMYMATLYMFGPPILDRALGKLYGDINYELFSLIIWNSLFISLFIYDWITLKRIHPISWGGVIWFYSIWGACFFLL